jgi:hypothetical protein
MIKIIETVSATEDNISTVINNFLNDANASTGFITFIEDEYKKNESKQIVIMKREFYDEFLKRQSIGESLFSATRTFVNEIDNILSSHKTN